MSKRILIVYESTTNPAWGEHGSFIPLGPLYVVSFLESKGIPADFIDRNVEYNKKIDFTKYDIVGFSVIINNIQNTLQTAYLIKKSNPEINIVFGGSFVNVYAEYLMDIQYIDAIIIGEGEEAFYEYVSKEEKNKIKGLYFRNNGKFLFTGIRQWIQELDTLPFPAIDKININKYVSMSSRRWPASNIITSRGCPYRCSFCFHNMGEEWRARSPKNVLDEIEWQVKKLGIKELIIQDDNFSFDIDRAKEIFDGIIKRKLKLSFQLMNGIMPNHIDKELMQIMSKAGVWLICFSPETGSSKTFKRLNKGFQKEDIEKAVKMAKECGIVTNVSFMVGFPWETEDDFKKTVELLFRLKTDLYSLKKFTPFPKTKLYNGKDIDRGEILKDKFYLLTKENTNDKKINKLLVQFYRKFYLNPKRLIKVIIVLRLYLVSKILRPFIFINIIRKIRNILKSSF